METYKILNKELVTQIQILKLNNCRFQIENNQLNKTLKEMHTAKILERCKINENVNQIFGVLNTLLTVVNPMINVNLPDTSKNVSTTPACKKPKIPIENMSELSPILDNSIDATESNLSHRRGRRSLRRSLPSFEKSNELNSACSSFSDILNKSSVRKSVDNEDEVGENSLEHNSVDVDKSTNGEMKLLSVISEDEEQESVLAKSKSQIEPSFEVPSIKEKQFTNRRANVQPIRTQLMKTNSSVSIEQNEVTNNESDSENETSFEAPVIKEKQVTNRRANFQPIRTQLLKTNSSASIEQNEVTNNESDSENETSFEAPLIKEKQVTNRRANVQPIRTQLLKTNSSVSIEQHEETNNESDSENETSFEAPSIKEKKVTSRRANIKPKKNSPVSKKSKLQSSKPQDSNEEDNANIEKTKTDHQSKTEEAEKSIDYSDSSSDTITQSMTSVHHDVIESVAVTKIIPKPFKVVASRSDQIAPKESSSDSSTEEVTQTKPASASKTSAGSTDSTDSSSDTITKTRPRRNVAETLKTKGKNSPENSDTSSNVVTKKTKNKLMLPILTDNSYETLANIQHRLKEKKEAVKKTNSKKGELSKKRKSDTSDSSLDESVEESTKTDKIKKPKLLKEAAEEKNITLKAKNDKDKAAGALSRKSHLDMERNFNIENKIVSSTPNVSKKLVNQTLTVRGAGSVLNDITSSSLNGSNRPRRNKEAVTYAEPKINKKMRR